MDSSINTKKRQPAYWLPFSQLPGRIVTNKGKNYIAENNFMGFPPDFKVKYRFFTQEEGGRKILPKQGYRSDFALEGDFLETGIELSVIHPEFEDENGEIIINETCSVLESGTARMWIMFPKAREDRHIHDIKVGLKGYFMEGPKRVAEAEIIEIIGLFTNPRTE